MTAGFRRIVELTLPEIFFTPGQSKASAPCDRSNKKRENRGRERLDWNDRSNKKEGQSRNSDRIDQDSRPLGKHGHVKIITRAASHPRATRLTPDPKNFLNSLKCKFN